MKIKTRLILKPGQKGANTNFKSKMQSRRRGLRRRRHTTRMLRSRRRANEEGALIWNWYKRLTDKYGDALVCVRFRYDAELRQRLKTVELAAGERWNPEKQLWFVRFGKIAGTPLEKHIHIDETGELKNK